MQMTAELSLYPLDADYETIVWRFINTLLEKEDISAVTNSMSTQVSGESTAVFAAIQRALELTYREFGKQVLVAKFIPEHRNRVSPEGTI
jgi:uncharacterized protein YqgV (UPF0045/DUF77 family)